MTSHRSAAGEQRPRRHPLRGAGMKRVGEGKRRGPQGSGQADPRPLACAPASSATGTPVVQHPLFSWHRGWHTYLPSASSRAAADSSAAARRAVDGRLLGRASRPLTDEDHVAASAPDRAPRAPDSAVAAKDAVYRAETSLAADVVRWARVERRCRRSALTYKRSLSLNRGTLAGSTGDEATCYTQSRAPRVASPRHAQTLGHASPPSVSKGQGKLVIPVIANIMSHVIPSLASHQRAIPCHTPDCHTPSALHRHPRHLVPHLAPSAQ